MAATAEDVKSLEKEFQSVHEATVHVDTLNAQEKEALTQAIARLGADAQEDTHVLQFLKAAGFNVDDCVARYKVYLAWRKEKKVDQILQNPPASRTLMEMVVPSRIFGFDKGGIPMYYEKTGRIMANELLCNVSEEDFLEFHTWMGETLRELCRSQSRKLGKKISTFNLVLDMDGLSLAHRNALSFLRVSTTFDEMYYPEFVERLFVINVPWIGASLWEMVKLFLAESLKKKVIMLGPNWKEELLQYVDADQLPKEYGGTADVAIRLSTSEEITNEAKKAVAHLQLEQKYVAAGECLIFTFEAEAGKEVEWAWNCDGGYDIDFKVEVATKAAPEPVVVKTVGRGVTSKGSWKATEPCTITVTFDNTFSYIYGKYLNYFVDLKAVH